MSRQAAILIIPADLSRPLILRRKDWDGPLWQVHQRGNGPVNNRARGLLAELCLPSDVAPAAPACGDMVIAAANWVPPTHLEARHLSVNFQGPAKVLIDCAVATSWQLQDEQEPSRD